MTHPLWTNAAATSCKSLIQLHIATGEPVGLGEPGPGAEPVRLPGHPAQHHGRPREARLPRPPPHQRGPHAHRRGLPGLRGQPDGPRAPRPRARRRPSSPSCAERDGSPSQVDGERLAAPVAAAAATSGFVLVPDIARTTLPAHRPRAAAPPADPGGDGVAHRPRDQQGDRGRGRASSQDELQACANYLNAHFAGMPLAAIRARLLELMREEKALYDSLLKKRGRVGERAFAGRGEPAPRVPGRRVEHARPAGVRGPRPHARPLQDLRGEEPAGEDPERLHLRRRRPHLHRPREPGSRAAATWPLVTASYPRGRRAGLGPRRAGLDAHGVRARHRARRPRRARASPRRCEELRS